jgi:hypothetical protein
MLNLLRIASWWPLFAGFTDGSGDCEAGEKQVAMIA